ncbi:MAG: zinc ribbon domain-containing protein [Anaerohalosphaeraceae bacterium]|nr:zinc ribbon domain-containing protein [Anaerohalosphaeraceae bacterium]
MPTYEYKCDNCGFEMEKFQTMSAKPLRKCPECGRLKLKRLIGSGAAVIFKGSGFYETDYRSDSYVKSQKSETTPKTDSNDSKKSDSKKESTTTEPKKTAKKKDNKTI